DYLAAGQESERSEPVWETVEFSTVVENGPLGLPLAPEVRLTYPNRPSSAASPTQRPLCRPPCGSRDSGSHRSGRNKRWRPLPRRHGGETQVADAVPGGHRTETQALGMRARSAPASWLDPQVSVAHPTTRRHRAESAIRVRAFLSDHPFVVTRQSDSDTLPRGHDRGPASAPLDRALCVAHRLGRVDSAS